MQLLPPITNVDINLTYEFVLQVLTRARFRCRAASGRAARPGGTARCTFSPGMGVASCQHSELPNAIEAQATAMAEAGSFAEVQHIAQRHALLL